MLAKKTVRLKPETLIILDRMAAKRGCNWQVIVREAVNTYLTKAGYLPHARPVASKLRSATKKRGAVTKPRPR